MAVGNRTMKNKKLNEWVKRYLPAEILATPGAIAGAGLIFFLTKNRILSVYAGIIGENIGFYGFLAIRESLNDLKNSKNEGKKHGIIGFSKTIRNLIIEFGFSEFLDSLIIRPFCLYIFSLIIKQFSIGIFVGKIVADLIFYIPTIIAYELRKRHLE